MFIWIFDVPRYVHFDPNEPARPLRECVRGLDRSCMLEKLMGIEGRDGHDVQTPRRVPRSAPEAGAQLQCFAWAVPVHDGSLPDDPLLDLGRADDLLFVMATVGVLAWIYRADLRS